jgi:hypothetical protein
MLASVQLMAVDQQGLLVLAGPEVTSAWLQPRFGGLICDCCEECGRGMRFASPQERTAIHRIQAGAPNSAVREHPTFNRR